MPFEPSRDGSLIGSPPEGRTAEPSPAGAWESLDPEVRLRVLAATETVGAELSTAESILSEAEARLHRVGAGLLKLRALAITLGMKLEVPEEALGHAPLASSAARNGRATRTRGSSRAIWLGIQRAAELLDEDPESLRKKLERAARRTSEGHLESDIDGVRGRKLARLWKVQLPPGWAAPGTR